MEDESGFTYHNSFLICDRTEAWLLETSGKYWAAERVKGNEKRTLSIGASMKCQGNGRNSKGTLLLSL